MSDFELSKLPGEELNPVQEATAGKSYNVAAVITTLI